MSLSILQYGSEEPEAAVLQGKKQSHTISLVNKTPIFVNVTIPVIHVSAVTGGNGTWESLIHEQNPTTET